MLLLLHRCPQCEKEYASSHALRDHTAKGSCTGDAVPQLGGQAPPTTAAPAPPAPANVTESSPHSHGPVALIEMWQLPPEETRLIQPPLLQQHGLALRADEGVVICIRCNRSVSGGRIVDYLDRHHHGWATGLASKPTNADFTQACQDALDELSAAGGPRVMLSMTPSPPHLCPPLRQVHRLEEGLAVYDVLWCRMCDRGYLTEASFKGHFNKQEHKESYGIITADRAMLFGIQTTAQRWTGAVGHQLFQVMPHSVCNMHTPTLSHLC